MDINALQELDKKLKRLNDKKKDIQNYKKPAASQNYIYLFGSLMLCFFSLNGISESFDVFYNDAPIHLGAVLIVTMRFLFAAFVLFCCSLQAVTGGLTSDLNGSLNYTVITTVISGIASFVISFPIICLYLLITSSFQGVLNDFTEDESVEYFVSFYPTFLMIGFLILAFIAAIYFIKRQRIAIKEKDKYIEYVKKRDESIININKEIDIIRESVYDFCDSIKSYHTLELYLNLIDEKKIPFIKEFFDYKKDEIAKKNGFNSYSDYKIHELKMIENQNQIQNI